MKYYCEEFERFWYYQCRSWVARLTACGKTQKDLALTIGVSPANLSKVLTGVYDPHFSLVHKIESCIREFEFIADLRAPISMQIPIYPYPSTLRDSLLTESNSAARIKLRFSRSSGSESFLNK